MPTVFQRPWNPLILAEVVIQAEAQNVVLVANPREILVAVAVVKNLRVHRLAKEEIFRSRRPVSGEGNDRRVQTCARRRRGNTLSATQNRAAHRASARRDRDAARARQKRGTRQSAFRVARISNARGDCVRSARRVGSSGARRAEGHESEIYETELRIEAVRRKMPVADRRLAELNALVHEALAMARRYDACVVDRFSSSMRDSRRQAPTPVRGCKSSRIRSKKDAGAPPQSASPNGRHPATNSPSRAALAADGSLQARPRRPSRRPQ